MEFIRDNSSYTAFPTYRVTLPTGGEVRLCVTSADHLHFDGNHHCLNGRPGDRCFMVCRGIEYGASIHFKLISGQWTVMDHPYTSRVGTSKDASPAAVKTLCAIALDTVREFYARHPEVFTLAEDNRVTRELEGLREKRAQLAAELAALDATIANLTK